MGVELHSQDVRSAALGCGVSAAALAAMTSHRRRAARRSLRREVATVMTTEVTTIAPDAPLTEAAERLAGAEAGALPVCDEHDRLLGVITDRDIVVRAVAHGEDPSRTRVGECVTPDPVTVVPLTTLEEAGDVMARHAVRRLPVMLDGKVLGMVSESDVARHAPPARAGALSRRLATAPGDRPSGAWLFRRAHGTTDRPASVTT